MIHVVVVVWRQLYASRSVELVVLALLRIQSVLEATFYSNSDRYHSSKETCCAVAVLDVRKDLNVVRNRMIMVIMRPYKQWFTLTNVMTVRLP